MSRLAQMMAAKRAAAKASKPQVREKLVTPVDPIVDPEVPTVENRPTTSPIAKRPSTVGALSEISTALSESLSDAEQKVADQRAAGVYDLAPEVTTLMGSDAEALLMTMQNLDAALVERTPDIRTLSYEIRKNLEQYPELVHILTDEQLHIMVQGYLTIANVKTAPKTKAAKTASANKKADASLKSLASKSLNELF